MNIDSVRRIADAVLYEGYILYPYRASAQKNQSRWQFGVVMAPGYAAAEESETSFTRAECVLEHAGPLAVQVLLRFLQVQRRTGPTGVWDEAVERAFRVGGDIGISVFIDKNSGRGVRDIKEAGARTNAKRGNNALHFVGDIEHLRATNGFHADRLHDVSILIAAQLPPGRSRQAEGKLKPP